MTSNQPHNAPKLSTLNAQAAQSSRLCGFAKPWVSNDIGGGAAALAAAAAALAAAAASGVVMMMTPVIVTMEIEVTKIKITLIEVRVPVKMSATLLTLPCWLGACAL